MRNRTRGFTLIELMIAVAILAIVAAIALPLYNQYSMRTYRAEAQADLMACAQGWNDSLRPISAMQMPMAMSRRWRRRSAIPYRSVEGRYGIALAYPGRRYQPIRADGDARESRPDGR
jgi:prepilin-type N-terminal cleavage/methylation domain-containing protein